MGANKSRPLVKESARVVLARKNAMPEAEKVANAAKQASQKSSENTALNTASPEFQQPKAKSAVNSSTVPPVAVAGSTAEQPLNSDVLNKVSKWQLKMAEAPATSAVAEMSASQIRAKFEMQATSDDANFVPVGKLTELQIHELFKNIRNLPKDQPYNAEELAARYKIDAKKMDRILKSARLPHFKKDEEDPDVVNAI
eukprot:gene25495-30780_t